MTAPEGQAVVLNFTTFSLYGNGYYDDKILVYDSKLISRYQMFTTLVVLFYRLLTSAAMVDPGFLKYGGGVGGAPTPKRVLRESQIEIEIFVSDSDLDTRDSQIVGVHQKIPGWKQ